MIGRLKSLALAGALLGPLAGCASGSIPNGPEQALYPWDRHTPGQVADCPPDAEDIRLNQSNAASGSLGCATARNIAAMVAYPSDLAGPQPLTAPDWGREERVLNAWREGASTQSAAEVDAGSLLP